MWRERLIRLGVLSFCMAVIAGRVFAASMFSPGSENNPVHRNGTNTTVSDCRIARVPAVTPVNSTELTLLRSSLSGVMGTTDGRLYDGGIVTSANVWSDNAPVKNVADELRASGKVPGAYEMRWWASSGDDIVADVFRFSTVALAHDFFERASSARCRPYGDKTVAISPPGGQNLVWLNPDDFMQADVFLVRGKSAYRVADVPRWQDDLRSAASRHITLTVVNKLACVLARAGCHHAVI